MSRLSSPDCETKVMTFLIEDLEAADEIALRAFQELEAAQARLDAIKERRDRLLAALRCLGHEPRTSATTKA